MRKRILYRKFILNLYFAFYLQCGHSILIHTHEIIKKICISFLAIEFLKHFLLKNSSEAQLCLSPIDWKVYLQGHSSTRLQLIREKTLLIAEKRKVMTLKDLALQPLEFRMNYVREFIQGLLSSWSGAEPGELDLNVGLHKYGVDSFAATHMRLQIKNNIGATFEVNYIIFYILHIHKI